MCFSATASFSAGAVLLGIGALTLKAADRPREWALAAIPLLSSHRTVQLFGVVAVLSFAAAYWFYTRWFISVWCFFAALLSVVVYLHFAPRRTLLRACKP